MNTFVAVVRQLAGLFVDDGSLALQIVAIILVAGIISALDPGLSFAAAGILLLGSLAALFLNVARTGRR